MFERLGAWVYRRRWWVIAVWLAAALLSLPLAPHVADALKVGGFSHDGLEAARVRATLERELGVPPASLVVNFHSPTLRADDPAFERQVRRALGGLEALPEVTGVTYHTYAPGQVSRDGHTAYAVVGLDVDPEEAQDYMPRLRERIQPTGLEMLVGGGPAFYADIERTSQADLQRAELVAFPLALAALVLVFGSVVAASIPVAVGGFTILVVLAATALLGRVTDLSIFALNVATLLGLGMAVDYALFLTSRFREELERAEPPEAVARTVGRAGRAVFFSGVVVLIGLGGLVTFEFMFLRSIGIVGALTVLISLLAALTLLPAILGVVGRRVDRLRSPLRLPEGRGFWAPLARWVMARPLLTLVPTLLVLLVLGLPFLDVRLSSPDPSILPAGLESRRAYDELRREFSPGSLAPVLVTVRSPDGEILGPRHLPTLHALSRRIAREPGVVRVQSAVDVEPRLTLAQYGLLYRDRGNVPDPVAKAVLDASTTERVAVLQVETGYVWNDPRAAEFVGRLRATELPGGLALEVGGAAAEIADVVSEMYGEFPRALLVIVGATYIALFLLLGSVLLPLKAILMNALSILASYGALVWVFQQGNLSGLLGFQPLGFVDTSLPILMFSTLFGLSMDYEVFLLARIKEEWERTGDNTQAVALGLERSGRIITSAALLVVVVGLAFVTAEIVLVKAIGLGVALAVFLDATLVRALLVPATMRLLGDWNWWAPQIVRRRLREARLGE